MPARNFSQIRATALAVAAILIMAAARTPSASAAVKYKTVHQFRGQTDGRRPYGSLTFDKAGSLYGTTVQGGDYRWGCVYQLTPNRDGSWSESILHSFPYMDGKDGTAPSGGVTFDSEGNLYGTTAGGGSYSSGTIFQLSPNGDGTWTENVLYSFDNSYGNGGPLGDLAFDPVGNLYGATDAGGNGQGTVFQLSPNGDGTWTENVLHAFNSMDGYAPTAGVIIDSVGNLYGTTYEGGAFHSGIVFQLTPNGDGSWTENVLHSFKYNDKDGNSPKSSLVLDPAGNVYGTTSAGGTYGAGTVFRLSPNGDGTWKERVLYSFKGDGKDGNSPAAGLALDAAGNLYGTTERGGVNGSGTVFRLRPTAKSGWKETVLHSFGGSQNPSSRLSQDGNGNFYGATDSPASVFEVTP